MKTQTIELTTSEYEELNKKYPESESNRLIERRAEEIVKIYFRKRDPQCQFTEPLKGADLRVMLSAEPAIDIEVKGTKSTEVAWTQLKVSS
jgi:hypothetical protein